MSEAENLRQVANNLTRSLRKSETVLAIWFFGAAQRQRVWEESDVDLLVLTEESPPAAETVAERGEVRVHLYWIGRAAFEEQIRPSGDRALHERVGGGELLYDRDDRFGPLMKRLQVLPEEYRVTHMVPHLDALLGWARDLRKRMALHDERPRRAAARQWEVDNHAASLLLLERGILPHNEPPLQALDARIFVPNMADPQEIEEFVRGRLEQWVVPQFAAWGQEGDFDAGLLYQRYGIGPASRLLQFAAHEGYLKQVKTTGRSGLPIQETLYRPA